MAFEEETLPREFSPCFNDALPGYCVQVRCCFAGVTFFSIILFAEQQHDAFVLQS